MRFGSSTELLFEILFVIIQIFECRLKRLSSPNASLILPVPLLPVSTDGEYGSKITSREC